MFAAVTSATSASICDLRIDLSQPSRRGDRFRQFLGDVAFVEENLAMEVVAFEKIAIDDAHESDAGSDELVGDHAAKSAAAADQRSGRQQSTLPLLAERSEPHLAAVAIEWRVGVAHSCSAIRPYGTLGKLLGVQPSVETPGYYRTIPPGPKKGIAALIGSCWLSLLCTCADKVSRQIKLRRQLRLQAIASRAGLLKVSVSRSAANRNRPAGRMPPSTPADALAHLNRRHNDATPCRIPDHGSSSAIDE